MLIALVVLIIIVCLLLGGIVLIQNPKGGGLSSTFGGVSNQILGASRSTDVVEKATWFLGGALMALSLISGVFYNGGGSGSVQEADVRSYEERINDNAENFLPPSGGQQQAPQGVKQQAPSEPAPPAQEEGE